MITQVFRIQCDGFNCWNSMFSPHQTREEAFDHFRHCKWVNLNTAHFCPDCAKMRFEELKPKDEKEGR